MDLEDQFDTASLLLTERRCRICGVTKNLIEDFYITHKNSTHLQSSYSYECKKCTINRITSRRKKDICDWTYPDW